MSHANKPASIFILTVLIILPLFFSVLIASAQTYYRGYNHYTFMEEKGEVRVWEVQRIDVVYNGAPTNGITINPYYNLNLTNTPYFHVYLTANHTYNEQIYIIAPTYPTHYCTLTYPLNGDEILVKIEGYSDYGAIFSTIDGIWITYAGSPYSFRSDIKYQVFNGSILLYEGLHYPDIDDFISQDMNVYLWVLLVIVGLALAGYISKFAVLNIVSIMVWIWTVFNYTVYTNSDYSLLYVIISLLALGLNSGAVLEYEI